MASLEIRELINKIYLDDYLSSFVKENNLNDRDIEKNLLAFLSYISSNKKCLNCPGLANCEQSQKGMRVNLKYTYKVEPCYEKCTVSEKDEKQSDNHLKTYGYNFDVIKNSKIYITDSRTHVLSLIKKFLKDYQNDLPVKGLYLHGSHGSGKTYLLAYIADKVSNEGKDVLFMFYPDLVRKMKSLVGTDKFEQALDELKTVDVLMLDDFGAETCTAFVRDDILSPVLQERMNNNLPTFMTSNLDDKSLIEHLSETSKSSDLVRATRIRARMQALMDFVELSGTNYRK